MKQIKPGAQESTLWSVPATAESPVQQSYPSGDSCQATLVLPPQGLQTSESGAVVTGCFIFEKANQ